MKSARILASFAAVALAVSMLVLSPSAFAKNANSGTFTLSDTARIGSTRLAPGTYKAEWTGTANNVKVNILEHGKTLATVDAELQDLTAPAQYDAVTLKDVGNNMKAVDTIQFNKHSESLKFAD
jgi:uncharacterized protein with FMN-binding domain